MRRLQEKRIGRFVKVDGQRPKMRSSVREEVEMINSVIRFRDRNSCRVTGWVQCQT